MGGLGDFFGGGSGSSQKQGGGIISPSSSGEDQAPQDPADVVGDPFHDPFFGSMLFGGQASPALAPYLGGQQQGDDQGYQQQAQPQQQQPAQQAAQQQQQNQPMNKLASEVKNVSKLLKGNDKQSAGWIQPQPQEQQRQQQPQNAQQLIQAAAPAIQRMVGGQPQQQAPAAQPAVQGGQQPASLVAPAAGAAGGVTQQQPAPATAPQQPYGGFLNTTLGDVANQIRTIPVSPLSDPMYASTTAVPETAPGPSPSSPATGTVPRQFDPASYIRSLYQIESNSDPYAVTGHNRGLAQFGPQEERMYGLNAHNRHDPRAVANALQREYEHHKGILQDALGRDPEPWESYLMHQQGLGGGPALLKADPNRLAWTVLRKFYRDNDTAIRAIGGNVLSTHPLSQIPAEQITAEQFRSMWRNRFNRSYYAGAQ